MNDTLLRYFWDNVHIGEGCWVWYGPMSEGYGRFEFECRNYYAHRLSYQIHKCDPTSLYVCHTCDNRLCVNPDHLFLSNHYGNQQDKFAKRRQAKGVETNHALLDDDKVRHIKFLLSIGLTQRRVARQMNVAQPTISDIKRGVSWKHIV